MQGKYCCQSDVNEIKHLNIATGSKAVADDQIIMH